MSEQEKSFRVGLIGTGLISDIYLKTLNKYPQVEVVAGASLVLAESRAKAEAYGVPCVASSEDIFEAWGILYTEFATAVAARRDGRWAGHAR
jgi:predicted dehydrogenase